MRSNMIHGHGGHGPPDTDVKDPVCGMDEETGKGYAKIHEGREYRFCGRKCLDQLEMEPQRYAVEQGAQR